MAVWKSKIVGHGKVAPDQLLAHPLNWRKHPQKQRTALGAAIEEVGFIRSVTVNKRTGNLIDGHERVWQALQSEQPLIDVEYVDLSPEEEAIALATLDTIGELSEVDPQKLDELLREVETGSDALQEMLADLAKDAGLYSEEDGDPGEEPANEMVISYNLVFDDEDQQQAWFGFLRGLRGQFPEKETHAARLVAFIEQSGLGAEERD